MRGVNAKTLDPAAERPRRRGKPEGSSDCTARPGCVTRVTGVSVPATSQRTVR